MQERTLVVFMLALIASGVFVWRLPEARFPPLLLVPFGIGLGFDELLSSQTTWLAFLSPAKPVQILGQTIMVSLGLIVGIAVWTVLITWACRLLWLEAESENLDLMKALRSVGPFLVPTFVALAVAIVTPLVLVALAAPLVAEATAVVALGLLLVTVLWNYLTAALLLHVTRAPGPVLAGLREGLAVSWRGKGRWLVPVMAQMLLLGLVTYFAVSYQRDGQFTENSRWNVSVQGTGGFEASSQWYDEYCIALSVEEVPLLALLLVIAGTVVAIGVKRRIRDELIEMHARAVHVE